MRLLLDTHVWIWSQEQPEKLGRKTANRLTHPEETLYVSTVSTLETARLLASGIILLSGTLMGWVSESLDSLRCGTIEISHEIAGEAYALPERFHRDPADRILVATARIHNLILATADDRILSYQHVRTLDARS